MFYSELNVSPQLHQAVERMGFTEMTEIQEKDRKSTRLNSSHP